MKKNTILIRGGRIIDPSENRDAIGDLLIENGHIVDAFRQKGGQPGQVIEAEGKIVCPGFVDIHVHFRDPGHTHKENIRSGSEAAAAGGFTTVVCMPNTAPVCDNAGTIQHILNAARQDSVIRVYPTGCLTKGMEGESLAPIGSLKKAGIVAVTDDGKCVQSNELMRQVSTYAEMFGLPVMDHCQDESLTRDAVMHEGEWSLRLGLRGWPAVAEDIIVARNILISRLTGAHIHMQHVSSGTSVHLLREAKKSGIRVSGEASPHHISLTDACLSSYDPFFKMNPPLRSESDRLALIAGLKDGTLDCIATDHAPHREYEKDVELDQAPFGIVGLETALSVCLETLEKESGFSLPEIIALLTYKPARLMNLPGGTLRKGNPADVTIWDPNQTWTPTRDAFFSQSHNSPWLGRILTGKVTHTLVAGSVVYAEGKILRDKQNDPV